MNMFVLFVTASCF